MSKTGAVSLLLGGFSLICLGLTSLIIGSISSSAQAALQIALVSWVLSTFEGAHHPYIGRDNFVALPKTVSASAIAAVSVPVSQLILGMPLVSMGELTTIAILSFLTLAGSTVGGRILVRSLWRRGEFRTETVLIGSGTLTAELALELRNRPELGIDVISHIDKGVDEFEPGELEGLLRELQPDRLIVGEPDSNETTLVGLARAAGTLRIRVYVLPRLFEMGVGNALFSPDQLRGFPLLRVNRSPHPQLTLTAKRTMDIVVSCLALVFLSPVLIASAIAIKLSTNGPILFFQERVGQHGSLIQVPKLCSMRTSTASDSEWTAADRITSVGRILRRTAIDELPQLWSVLMGDMSLVGPRPERPVFSEQFSEEHSGYSDRLRMRVGLTGLSQIAGLRGDTSIAERTKYDNLYIDQWTLTGDLVILFRTVGAIFNERTQAQEHARLEQAILDLRATDRSDDRPRTAKTTWPRYEGISKVSA